MLPIKLDLSRLSYPSALQLVGPIVPGGVLVIGWLFANQESAGSFLGQPNLGYYSKIGLVIFFAYVFGFGMTIMSNALIYFVSVIMARLLKNKIPSGEPWKSKEWRKAAKKFIGEDLAPRVEDPFYEQNFSKALEETKSIGEPQERMNKLRALMDYYIPLQTADFEWFSWHQVLRSYFRKPNPERLAHFHLLSVFHTTVWSFAFVLITFKVWSPSVWFMLALSLLTALLAGMSYHFVETDPTGPDLTAEIIRELRLGRQDNGGKG